MDQKKQNLQRALANFKASKFEFDSEAAHAYDVPSLTFSDRLNTRSHDKLHANTSSDYRLGTRTGLIKRGTNP
ncbi:uncharacterized protein K441DRAFT_665329 [Cenococcum geophilum 1.58]|uniref:uncharacterized protein n=1 Tax=Cenococcum geophilum 1.58 TaxID=794803 RepID=UPI00358F8BB0|nr:hypothetical protein K441DRAFT_665329 [Cenococcum geophilum 1.58]